MATRGPANPRAALYIAVLFKVVKALVIDKGADLLRFSEGLDQDGDQGGRQGGDEDRVDKSGADLVQPHRGVHRMHCGSPSFVFGRLLPFGFVSRTIVSGFPEVMNAATSFLTINR